MMKYQVVLECQTSAPTSVLSGVWQGTVLGALLFLIYINDLPSNVKSATRLFADDTIVYRKVQTETDADILQDDLDDLQKWVSTWLMEFNVDKCQLRVTNKRKPINRNYTLNGKQLPLVVEVTVDWKLSWNEHMLLPHFLLWDVTFGVWLPTCNIKIYVRVTHV